MSGTTITLGLEGDISLASFTAEMGHFQRLIDALTKEVAQRTKIDWLLDGLEYGSAIATIRGESPSVETVERVVAAYASVGKHLEQHLPIPYSNRVAGPAFKLVSMLNGEITALRFQTHDEEATIFSSSLEHNAGSPHLMAYGAVEGRVQTVSSRGGLRFTLYDALLDKAVSCFLSQGQQELMRDIWGRRAIVEGMVTRDSISGRPVSIRQVRFVDKLPDVAPGAFLRARGILPRKPNDPLPEDMIRRMRDA